jgi:hypothetical protein
MAGQHTGGNLEYGRTCITALCDDGFATNCSKFVKKWNGVLLTLVVEWWYNELE